MRLAFTGSRISVRLRGKAIAGAEDRQRKVAGFDQVVFSKSRVLCIGAGGLISHIAPTLARKGIGRIILLDGDMVEASNLNRQRFYAKDLGSNKAVAMAENLKAECIAQTEIHGYAFRFEEAIYRRVEIECDVAICGVDNNPTRLAATRYARIVGIPVIFSAVSQAADHGYVFVQEKQGACLACLLPDMVNDDRYPCPGTPATADILQAVGALSVYAVDSVLMGRKRNWNYRRISLSDGASDGAALVGLRPGCGMFGGDGHQ
jgi:molybdopterin-synthase adenylyltransferase